MIRRWRAFNERLYWWGFRQGLALTGIREGHEAYEMLMDAERAKRAR